MLKKFVKLLSLTIALFIMFVSINKIYALQSNFHATVDESDPENPFFKYRTFTAAGDATISRYNSATNKQEDGWAYVKGESSKLVNTSFRNYLLREETSGNYFRSRYTYIHPVPNSEYIGNSGTYKYYRYDSDGTSTNPKNASTAQITRINAETAGYKGFYDKPAMYGETGSLLSESKRAENGIYIMAQNDLLQRMKVEGRVYISDMSTTATDYKSILNLFYPQIKDQGYVYISELTYSKAGSDAYIKNNMDTAYKFNKNMLSVYGATGNSIGGGKDGKGSFLNLYDNKIYIPLLGDPATIIYVRHIDVTDQDYITKEVVENVIGDSKFKKVGYATNKDATKSYFSSYESPEKQYEEKFILEELEENEIITVYNKLYSDITKKSTVGGSILDDNTDYSGYELVGTVTGVGTSKDDAVKNRDSKYDNLNQLEVRQTVDIFGENIGNYVVIDFLYKKQRDAQVYIRHIDVTGIADNNFNSTTISNYARSQSYSQTRYIKNVGFARTGIGVNYNFNETLYSSPITDTTREYEHYTLLADTLKNNDWFRFFNKLYNSNTKTSEFANTRDYTDYSQYEFVKCVSGQGNTVQRAIENRDNNINNSNFSQEQYLDYINTTTTDPYVYIDFYYRKKSPFGGGGPGSSITPKVKVLVRHINVSGMGKTSPTAMDSYVNNGTLGIATFNGNENHRLSSNGTFGKSRYLSFNNYYNEIYRELNANTSYNLYNEFYDNSDSDFTYIGYIIGTSNYSLGLAEDARNEKLENADFNLSNPILDGGKGSGIVKINTGNNEFIVVDMYYKEKNSRPIKFAELTGRLSFDAVCEFNGVHIKNDFKNTTKGAYDKIPSDEELYASITNANKYFLGGIRVVPMKIEGTQKVIIEVNMNYKYLYEYAYGASCSAGHSSKRYDEVGKACTTYIRCDCESPCECDPCECGHYCEAEISLDYKEDSTEETITKTFCYILPYSYEYYKISNMRVYKIDHMILDDRENTTDLPLFDGKIHEIGMTKSYRDSVKGSFVGSDNNQTFTDDRSVDSISSSFAEKTTSKDLKESVNLPQIEFEQETYDDKFYTKDTAESKRKTAIQPTLDSIMNKITVETAPTIISVDTEGEIQEKESGTGPKVKFYVNSDKIRIGSVDMLASKDGERFKTEDIEIEDELTKDTTKTVLNNRGESYDGKVEFAKLELKVDYPTKIKKQYGFKTTDITSKTSQKDFEEKILQIPMSRLNGERISKAEIYYKILEDGAINFDATSTDLNDDNEDGFVDKKHDWSLNSVTDSGSFKDTEMYDKEKGEIVETRVTTGGNLPLERIYKYKSDKNRQEDDDHGSGDIVNVFTPIKFKVSLNNGQTEQNPTIVDHTIGNNKVSSNQERIQKGTRFTLTITPDNSHDYYKHLTDGINKYIEEYYIKFDDLDVQGIIINGTINFNNGASVSANTWIGPIKNIGNNTTISAIAKENPNYAAAVLGQETDEYTVRGVTKNVTSLMLSDLASGRYSDTLVDKSKEYLVDTENENKAFGIAENLFSRSGSRNIQYHGKYYIKKKIYNDNNHVAETTSIPTKNLSRVYDFKITDVRDLDWKDTFRKTTATNTNTHSGIAYYSGINKLNIYSSSFNTRLRRTTDEIGVTSQRILPVGPYKNTNTSYTYAPKLGYRFSFDFKTTGILQKNKTAKITVSFMFIDKTKNLPEGKSRLIKEIDLYYKDSSNKYVKIDPNNEKMFLYFVPDDGYRLTFTEDTYNFNNTGLSNKTLKLGSLTELNLNKNMRAESDNGFTQIWYGEYKLPNSTIAVKKGVTDLNKKLTNGYIAVKFNIEVTDYYSDNEQITIAYGQNDKSTNNPNTSQWDYEGYLGFNAPGSEANNLSLRLDTGVYWNITNTLYNDLKGTVILYDADARASNDYN